MSGGDGFDFSRFGRALRGLVENAADAFDAAGHPHGKKIREHMKHVDEKVRRTSRDAGGALGKLSASLERLASSIEGDDDEDTDEGDATD